VSVPVLCVREVCAADSSVWTGQTGKQVRGTTGASEVGVTRLLLGGREGNVIECDQADASARPSRLAKRSSAWRQYVGSINTGSPVAGRIQPCSVRRHSKASGSLRFPELRQSSRSVLKGAVAIDSNSLMTRPAEATPSKGTVASAKNLREISIELASNGYHQGR
jgi:hypothetical protein